MTQLVEFAESKNATEFETVLHARIAEKVAAVLDGLRETVAERLFNEEGIDENAIDTPGGGIPGGISGGAGGSAKLPSPPSSVKFPGKADGGARSVGSMPELGGGALNPNSPEFNRKGDAPIPANEASLPGKPAHGASKGHGKPDKNAGALDPNSVEFNRKGRARIPANR